MGAHISVEGRLAIIEGGSPLTAAPVSYTHLDVYKRQHSGYAQP